MMTANDNTTGVTGEKASPVATANDAVSYAQIGLDCLAAAQANPTAAPGLLRAAARNLDKARREAERLRGRPMGEPG